MLKIIPLLNATLNTSRRQGLRIFRKTFHGSDVRFDRRPLSFQPSQRGWHPIFALRILILHLATRLFNRVLLLVTETSSAVSLFYIHRSANKYNDMKFHIFLRSILFNLWPELQEQVARCKITLQRTNNAIYSIFCTILSHKRRSSNDNTIKNTISNKKYKFVLNTYCVF